MVTFEEIINVKLDGKHCGVIKRKRNGYAYFPAGDGVGGDVFPSIALVKKDIS